MFALLILEVADRVVMKRDLQIAKEIQTWLLPANPPVVFPDWKSHSPPARPTPSPEITMTSSLVRAKDRATRF